jgi:sortase B
MKAEIACRRIIKATGSVIDFAALTVIILLLAFAGYALWDSKQIFEEAKKENYTVYKPTEENGGLSFEELQAINPEAFAWITIYGTNIDYPVVQGEDNMKYVNTNALGRYSLTGAIFLDYRNDKNFSDFNNILYGHHMAGPAMFGEVGWYKDKEMFDTRKYGDLYYDGVHHGIEIFSYLHTDAYDSAVFNAQIEGSENQRKYLENLLALSTYTRDIGVSTEDKLILLSTCSSYSTNGRDVVTARITDEVFEDTFITETIGRGLLPGISGRLGLFFGLPVLLELILLTVTPALIVFLAINHHIKKKKTIEQKRGRSL